MTRSIAPQPAKHLKWLFAFLPIPLALAIFAVVRFTPLSDRVSRLVAAPYAAPLSITPARFLAQGHAGDAVNASFTVTNTGTRPIKLLGVESSCGCNAADGLPTLLAPGAAGQVNLRVKLAAPTSDGRFSSSTSLLADCDGYVPPLVVDVNVRPLPDSAPNPKR